MAVWLGGGFSWRTLLPTNVYHSRSVPVSSGYVLGRLYLNSSRWSETLHVTQRNIYIFEIHLNFHIFRHGKAHKKISNLYFGKLMPTLDFKLKLFCNIFKYLFVIL